MIGVSFCLSNDVYAENDFYENGYTYTVDDKNEATIVKADTTLSGEVIIPDTLGGYPVVKIGSYSFENCRKITHIIISDNVRSIGSFALEQTNISTVTLGKKVETIGYDALKSSGLQNYIVDEENMFFSNDERGVLFNKNKTTLYDYPLENHEETYVIPDTVEVIEGLAFSGSDYLKSITIGDSVTDVGHSAFSSCDILETVIIGKKLKNIPEDAFSSSNKITNFVVDEENEMYSNDEDGVLYKNEKTELVKYPSGNKRSSYTIAETVNRVSGKAFYYCNYIEKLVITDNVRELDVSAFVCCNNLKSVTIGKGLTTIGDGAFYQCVSLTGFTVDSGNDNFLSDEEGVLFNKDKTKLIQYPIGKENTSYIIPSSVITVGKYAFDSCKNLITVSGGAKVKYIEYRAFYYCTNITEISLGGNIISVGRYAFYYCYSLKTVNYQGTETQWNKVSVDGDNHWLTDCTFNYVDGIVRDDGLIESGNCSENVYYTLNEDGLLYIFGEGIMYKGNNPPWESRKDLIKTVIIENGVTSIGDAAFRYLTNVESITIPDTVTYIGYWVFDNCTSLEKLIIPDSVTFIDEGCFDGCTNLKEVKLPAKATGMGGFDFRSCSSLERVTIPEGVTDIANRCFYNCKSLKEVLLPESVTSIGEFAFAGCNNLESVNIPENVKSIGEWAFWACSSISEIVIPYGVEAISYRCFNTCTSLKKVVIPDSVTSIESCAFNLCYILEDFEIPEGVTTIGEHAFMNCKEIESITIPESVTVIEKEAFNQCDKLKSVVILNSECIIYDDVATFGRSKIELSGYSGSTAQKYAEKYGKDFVRIKIDNSYEFSDGVLFIAGENPIESVEDEYVYEWNQYAESTDAIVIEGVPYIGKNAFDRFNALTVVVIQSNDIILDDGAFNGCMDLKSVISFGNTDVKENAFIGNYDGITLYVEKGKELFNNSQNVITKAFYQDNNTVFFESEIELSSYELFNIIAALCIEYNDVDKLHFDKITASDIQFIEWQNENEAMWVDSLTDVNFSVKIIQDGTEQIVSYNELCGLVSDGTVTSFHLVAESDSSYRIEDTEVFTEPQNFILRFSKALIALLNKLFTIFSKKK